jgi:hypothetical protein
MTPISRIQSEPIPRTYDRPAPPRDKEQRFEDALARNTSEDRDADTPAEAREKASGELAGDILLPANLGKGRDEGDQRRASRGLDETSCPEFGAANAHFAQVHTSVVPDAAPAQSSSAMPTASFAEMAMRMALPQGVHSVETSLLMTDPRWIASRAVIVQDSSGAMSLDVGTRQDGSSEQQRQELRARLEARGHRLASIRMHQIDQ